MSAESFQSLATTVLVLHLFIVAFVVLGLVAILAGNGLGWSWVNVRPWRLLHLATMVFVAAEAWLGMVCPLTTLEQWLKERAGLGAGADHEAGFVASWVERLLYYDLPAWVFLAGYTLFALAIVAAWIRFPPARRPPGDRGREGPGSSTRSAT